MATQITSNKKEILVGINIVGDLSRVTLGPRGKNQAIDKGFGAPNITNDTVSIVREITLSDKFQNMGAEVIKEIAEETYDKLRDSTTTAVVLGQAIANEGTKHNVSNVMELRDDMKSATNHVIEVLRELARPVETIEDLKQVAFRSSESMEIAEVVAKAVNEVGKNGMITIEGSTEEGIRYEVGEGMEINEGYISSEMVTDKEVMDAEYLNPLVLVTDKRISSIQEMLPLFGKLVKAGKKELVIIADDVDGDALTTFVLNKKAGTFNVLAIKAPGYGERKKEELKDIAINLGADIISDETGLRLETVELRSLGRATKIVSKKRKTLIMGGGGNLIGQRVEEIKRQIKESKSKYDKEKLEERLAKLLGKVGVIHVGVNSPAEMRYLKKKIENSINSTQMAADEGIVMGGGSALVKAVRIVRSETVDNSIGYRIVLKACEAPFREIINNSGKRLNLWNRLFNKDKLIKAVATSEDNCGYDALRNELVYDMFDAGIVDPVKSTIVSLQIASDSIALLLTCGSAITNEK